MVLDTLSNGTRRISISGDIDSADQCHVALWLVERNDIRGIAIDSPGGDAWAGTRLARVIGWSGLPVVVPRGAKAHSAAAIAVMGAASRRLEGDIGFHAPYLTRRTVSASPAGVKPWSPSVWKGPAPASARTLLAEVTAETRSILRRGGMSDAMIGRVMATAPTKLWRPERAMLEAMRPTVKADRPALERLARTCRDVMGSLR